MRTHELAALAYLADFCPDPIEIDDIVEASLDRLETEPDWGGPEGTLYHVLAETLHAMCEHRGAVPPDAPGRQYLTAIVEREWATADRETLALFDRLNPVALRRSAVAELESIGSPILPHLIRGEIRDRLARYRSVTAEAEVELLASWIS